MKRAYLTLLIICTIATLSAIATPHASSSDVHQASHIVLSVETLTDAHTNTLAANSAETTTQYAYNDDNYNDDEIEIIPAQKTKKTKKKKKKKSFNSPKTKDFWGFSAGYASQSWRKRNASGEETPEYFQDGKNLHGIQLGIRFNPLFKYGFGIDTGIYYEYYHYRNTILQENTAEGNEYRYQTLNEHILRIPLHIEYRLNFSKSFQLFIFGGITADYVIYGDMIISEQNSLENSNNEIITDIYGTYIPSENRYNVAWSFGGGIRFGAIQFNVNSTRGFLNCSPGKEYVIQQDNPLNITMSVMF